MRVLIIKTSSLGDVIHTLPALTDAANHYPDIQFDWVIEESFQEIPKWHPTVNKVIPVALRRWRKDIWGMLYSGEFKKMVSQIRQEKYDLVIDAQGLLKSAFLTVWARSNLKAGFSWKSARESLASLFYSKHTVVSWKEHAIFRTRSLFARSLDYSLQQESPINYGLDSSRLPTMNLQGPYCVFLHGTTWATKHWPETYWQQLAQKVSEAGFKIQLLWGNEKEQERAKRIASVSDKAFVVPEKLSLVQVASVLSAAQGIVTVDTGLGHLAAAVGVPTISLYGPTDPGLCGTKGEAQIHLSSDFSCAPCYQRECTYQGNKEVDPPCFSRLAPDRVWQTLETQMAKRQAS